MFAMSEIYHLNFKIVYDNAKSESERLPTSEEILSDQQTQRRKKNITKYKKNKQS